MQRRLPAFRIVPCSLIVNIESASSSAQPAGLRWRAAGVADLTLIRLSLSADAESKYTWYAPEFNGTAICLSGD
jgi:hypothetical protein